MPFANHTPYDHFPRRLHPREIGNPYLAIHQFFDWENFPEWRNHLDRWLQAALKSGFQLNRIELVELFVRYEFIELLVEALSLVQRLMDSFHMPDQRLYRQMANDSDKLLPDQINTAHGYFNNGHNPKTFEREEYYPFHLEAGEKKNPHGVIYDFSNIMIYPNIAMRYTGGTSLLSITPAQTTVGGVTTYTSYTVNSKKS